MSKRSPTALEYEAELLRRILYFNQSDLAQRSYTGMVVNHEGCMNTKNPAIQLLVARGIAEIIRRNEGRMELVDRSKSAGRYGGRRGRNYSILRLKGPQTGKVELTCPCCGEMFVKKGWDEGKWHRIHLGDFHKYNCMLRTDHFTWRDPRRQNEVAQGLRGRKVKPSV